MADLLVPKHASLSSTGSVTYVTGVAICSFCHQKAARHSFPCGPLRWAAELGEIALRNVLSRIYSV
jgi:hypothetical protein